MKGEKVRREGERLQIVVPGLSIPTLAGEVYVHGVKLCVYGVEFTFEGSSLRLRGRVCVHGVELAFKGSGLHSLGRVCVHGVEFAFMGSSLHSWGQLCVQALV